MATFIHHQWVARAKCDCGFIWTNPGAPSVVCACRASILKDDVLISGPDLAHTDTEFKQAVADDLGVGIADLLLEKV